MSEVLLIPAGVRAGWYFYGQYRLAVNKLVNARRGGPVDIVLVDNDVAPVR